MTALRVRVCSSLYAEALTPYHSGPGLPGPRLPLTSFLSLNLPVLDISCKWRCGSMTVRDQLLPLSILFEGSSML